MNGVFFFIWEKPAAEKIDEIYKDGLTWWANRYSEIFIFKKRERKRNGNKTVITFKIYLLENDCYTNRRCILLFVIYEEFHLRKVKSGRPGLAFSIKRTSAVLELHTLELAWIGPYLYLLKI